MNGNLLHPRPVSSDRFTWYPEGQMFTAEQSDIGPFGQVYADACDEGLTLVSARRPGQPEVVFVVEHTERRDGDILYWDLKPAPRQQAAKSVGFTVRVYND